MTYEKREYSTNKKIQKQKKDINSHNDISLWSGGSARLETWRLSLGLVVGLELSPCPSPVGLIGSVKAMTLSFILSPPLRRSRPVLGL